MNTELKQITVGDVAANYYSSDDGGTIGYHGRLDIRPPFQREFVYKEKERNAVIKTIYERLPLGVMYWIVQPDGMYQLLDGQQRTVSFCQYIHGGFSVNLHDNTMFFHNLTDEEQARILNYPLQVYFCSGTQAETLAWFKVINTHGEPLTAQEMRSAVYVGPWITDAKSRFVKKNGSAHQIASGYMKGSMERQDWLETAIKWIAKRDRYSKIEEYMGLHQHDEDAEELWSYFQSVMNWTKMVFPEKRKNMMCGLPWGIYFNIYHKQVYDANALEKRIKELLDDDDVTNQSGIYEYLLSGEKLERCLNIRTFDKRMKRTAYERQDGICPMCKQHFEFSEMEGDHIKPWAQGGTTTAENCQMLCKACNQQKGGR